MCGIAGIFHYGAPGRPVDRGLLERMTRALAHRGPDGEGFHVEGPLGLGHRRLAIVDLTPTGAQPMANEDGSCWITYNGELYNHAGYRDALAGRHTFRGRSDTETLLHLLEEDGPDGLERASGIFAFAFWDGRNRTLTLARDALGVKQLYFHDDGRRILFASEIKALLLAEDVERDLDPEAVNQYLHFHTPLFERTFFRGIRQVQPGEYVRWPLGGERRSGRFWSLREVHERGGRPQELVAELREELAKAVSAQLMSDVPVGAFLSGGIDSSAVASYARRSGQAPRCFGVHFSDQGVIDERPYQEAAASALGLELELLTLDGATFADDLPRLLWQQDQPVIGSAMIPMFHVSRLASQKVKVCLGGQAADEIFGGYARYSLAHPWRTAAAVLTHRGWSAGDGRDSAQPNVGGNLWMQLRDPRTLRRVAANVPKLFDWQDLYFSNFAKVPEAVWRGLFDAEEVVSRESCWATFRDVVARSPMRDPAAKVMHWDLQTYLPGLFQQDDRMSMANGLESRVPFADPRLVEFAFRVPFGLKVRDGASKWLLRRAVSDVLPEMVLNRRKVGFDTPVERWMKGPHAGFVRETLLSRAARHRGLWNTREVADWLDHPGRNLWADVVWKLLCIELWAQRMLDDGRPERTAPTPPPSVGAVAVDRTRPQGAALAERGGWRNRLQELRELGPGGLRFRVGWEARTRTGLAEWLERPPPPLLPGQHPTALELAARLPFDAPAVATAMTKRLGAPERDRLVSVAEAATRGKILAFGRWFADYGVETDWHLNPVNGRRWNPERHWSRVLSEERRVGDIKLTWEIGRFPHAYFMARAATHVPEKAPALAASMAGQIRRFAEANPFALGAHWASGQEIVFRLMGWLFALGAMGPKSALAEAAPEIARALHLGAIHVERHLDYTLKAVYNNHLLSEAFGLLLAGELLPAAPEAARWRVRGLEILGDQAGRQFYEDGAYIQQSHNYERVALQVYLWAVALLRQKGDPVPPPWLAALDRATTFLHANQNPADGRLPNYGANDGALVSPFTSCDYSDFRPVLQAASVAARGERLYEPGPWDEETAWLLGPASLEAPLLSRPRRSVSFVPTGFHVLRGKDESSFAAFRCGTVRDRFSQIDMLSLDVWWRGENVLVDPGSYLYNGPARWHDHFMCTGSHNTVTVDGRDQMLHYRRFKNLYWTEARLLGFEDHGEYVLAQGEHHGYRRHPGGCVHRRGVLLARDDLWVVLDQVSGEGSHACRLHWLAGEYPYAYDPEGGRLSLTTPAGEFSVITLNEQGAPLVGDVAAGRSGPPSGWLSRYYGEKRAVPSLAIELAGMVPLTVVSILSGGCPEVAVQEGCWTVRLREVALRFAVADGRFKDVRVERTSARSDLA